MQSCKRTDLRLVVPAYVIYRELDRYGEAYDGSASETKFEYDAPRFYACTGPYCDEQFRTWPAAALHVKQEAHR